MSEKTEKPTARQLRRAREQGDVPVSSALSQAFGLLFAFAVLPAAASAAGTTMAHLLRTTLQGYRLTPSECAEAVLILSTPLLLVAAFASGALSFSQGGGVFSFSRIAPKLERLDVFEGFKSLISAPRLFGLLRALSGAFVCGLIAWLVLRSTLRELGNTPGELAPALALAGKSSERLLGYAAMAALALGLIDLAIVRRAWEKRWMMSKDEVKREYRETEGDPEIKAARARAHREALFSSSLFAVKDASVVIVNPTHLATALGYDENEDEAPRVIAQGQGDLARRIIEAAHLYNVPVIRDVPVARALSELEIGDQIPEVLYEAVAAILRDVWDAEKKDDA